MKTRHRSAIAAGLVFMFGATAHADHRPVIAVPGNWEVPVTVDGVPASGALVTGDWGLYAPGRVVPEVYGPAYLPPEGGGRGYFPRTGHKPRYGRQEVFVPRRLTPPAPTFHREWWAESGGGPVSAYPPFDPPALAPPQQGTAPHRIAPGRRMAPPGMVPERWER